MLSDVSFSSGCVISPSLPPLWLWLCVSSCLRTFRVSPLMCCCSLVLLNISHRHIWRTEKKGAVANSSHSHTKAFDKNMSVHLSLGCKAEHMIVSRGPSLAFWRCWRSYEALWVLTGALIKTWCFFSSIVLSVVPSYCMCDPLPFSFEIFPVCVTTPAYTISVDLDNTWRTLAP